MAWSTVFLAPSRKERLGPKQEQPMSHGRCEHATYPVEVLPVGGGNKKIAYCLGCGRSGRVCESSAEAVVALREAPRLALQQRRPAEKASSEGVALADRLRLTAPEGTYTSEHFEGTFLELRL